MVYSSRFGRNYSLIFNVIVFLLLILIITTGTKSDSEIIIEYQNDNLPVMEYDGRISGDQPQFDIDNIWNSFTNVQDQIRILDHLKTKNSFSHSEITTIGETSFNETTIYYVSHVFWSELIHSNDTELIIVHHNDITTDANTVNLEREGRNITLEREKIEYMDNLPEFFQQSGNRLYSGTPGLTPSNVNTFGIILPFPSDTGFFQDMANLNWNILSQFYLKQSILLDTKKIETILGYVDTIVSQIEKPLDGIDFTSNIDPILYQALNNEKNRLYNQFESNLAFIIPVYLSIEVLFIYFLNTKIKALKERFELLFTRGYSTNNIRNDLIKWYVLIPTFLITVVSIGTNYGDVLNKRQLAILISLIIPWILMQFFSCLYLIFRIVRNFKVVLKDHKVTVDIKSEDNWTKIWKTGTIIALIILIILIVRQQTKKWESINEVGTLPGYFVPLAFFIIFLLLFLFSYSSAKYGKDHSNDIETYFSFQLLSRKRGLYIFSILLLMVSIGFYSTGILDNQSTEDVFIETNISDFHLSFSESSGDQPVFFNHEDIMQIEGLTNYLIEYHEEIVIIGNNYEFSTQITLYNQSLYDNFDCRSCSIDTNLFEDKIWINQELKSFLFRDGDVTSLSQINDTTDGISFTNEIDKSEFDTIPFRTPLIGKSRGQANIVTSVENFLSLGYDVNWPSLPEIYLNFNDTDLLDPNEVNQRTSEKIDFNGNEIRILDTRDTERSIETNNYDFTPPKRILYWSNYLAVIVVSLLLVQDVIFDDKIISQLILVNRRYGYSKLIKHHFLICLGFGLAISLIGLISGLLFSLFVLANNLLVYSNYQIHLPFGYNLLDLLVTNSGPILLQLGIYGIGATFALKKVINSDIEDDDS